MQKGLIFLALFVILSPSTLLSYDSYWLKLLHFNGYKSEIDDPSFFLSPTGNIDPQSEFDATIKAIKTDQNISCRYPARIEYIYKKYPDLLKGIPKKECKELNELLKEIDGKKVVLIFPTAHINSPASMFGHSFLRIDSNTSQVLTSNAINYAANTDEKNGLFFAYYGLTGGYKGKYSALPYYKKIKEYSNLESRDIWEYELNLTPKEIRKMLLHLYEIKDSYSDYYFFTKNCSYNLLWLLEVARDDLNLVDNFSYKAIPIDTIKVIKKANLIVDVKFRASRNRKTLSLIKAKDTASGDLKKAYETTLDIEKLKLKRKAKEIDKQTYTKKLISKLAYRSTLPKTPTPLVKKPTNPLKSHDSSRAEFGIADDGYLLGYKAAFHDIYDLDFGFIDGAYIDFFHIQLFKKRDESIELKKLDLIKINSYALINNLFKHISWGVDLGFDNDDFKDSLSLSGEIGRTRNLFGWDIYTLIKPTIKYKNSLLVGIGPKVGGYRNFDIFKLGISYKHIFYSDGDDKEYMELFLTKKLSDKFALNLKLEDVTIDKEFMATIFYYF